MTTATATVATRMPKAAPPRPWPASHRGSHARRGRGPGPVPPGPPAAHPRLPGRPLDGHEGRVAGWGRAPDVRRRGAWSDSRSWAPPAPTPIRVQRPERRHAGVRRHAYRRMALTGHAQAPRGCPGNGEGRGGPPPALCRVPAEAEVNDADRDDPTYSGDPPATGRYRPRQHPPGGRAGQRGLAPGGPSVLPLQAASEPPPATSATGPSPSPAGTPGPALRRPCPATPGAEGGRGSRDSVADLSDDGSEGCRSAN